MNQLNAGPPPNEGWWQTMPTGGYRYWNGIWWSCEVDDLQSEKEASIVAQIRSPFQDMIKWNPWGFRLPAME